MEWSRRAPAPPAIEAGQGCGRQGARDITESPQCSRRNRHCIGKNSFHGVGLDTRGAIVMGRSGRAARWKHGWPRRPADTGEVRAALLEGDKAMTESLIAFKRAGADGVLTYFAMRIADPSR